jgi:Protein of unknown function (DUF3515)
VTLPFVVILALVLGNATKAPKTPADSGPPVPRALAPVTVAAPPADPAAAAPCTKLLTTLPVQLGELQPRVVHPKPDSPFVVAWGDPVVVLRCGVARPSALKPGSGDLVIGVNGVFWLPVRQSKATVWVTVDRAVYIEVTVPQAYRQPPLAPLADAVAKVLLPVCVVQAAPGQPAADPNRLCTNRK